MEEKVFRRSYSAGGGFTMESCNHWWSTSASCTSSPDEKIFLQYELTTRSGQTVAVSPYLELFSDEFSVYDPGTGNRIARLQKNGAWKPQNKCPLFAKNWLLVFEEPTAATASTAAVTTQDKRWVIAAMVAMMALRDDTRKTDGMVAYSVCEIETGVLLGIMIAFAVLLVLTGLVLWVKLHWREATIRFFQELEDGLLPKVVVGVGAKA